MEVCDSLTALSVENGLSPSPSDTAPAAASPSTPCTRMGEKDVGLAKGPGKGMPGVRAGEEGMNCHGSCPSVTPCTQLQGVWWDSGMSPCHHHYWLATLHLSISFFANYKYLCILIGRIKLSLLLWGTLVIGSKWFVLSPCTSCIWEVVKNFKHLAMF